MYGLQLDVTHFFHTVRNYIEIISFESIHLPVHCSNMHVRLYYLYISRSCPVMAVSPGAPKR